MGLNVSLLITAITQNGKGNFNRFRTVWCSISDNRKDVRNIGWNSLYGRETLIQQSKAKVARTIRMDMYEDDSWALPQIFAIWNAGKKTHQAIYAFEYYQIASWVCEIFMPSGLNHFALWRNFSQTTTFIERLPLEILLLVSKACGNEAKSLWSSISLKHWFETVRAH